MTELLTEAERQYVTTALWSSIDDQGQPLDDAGFDQDGIADLPEFLAHLNDFLAMPEVVGIMVRHGIDATQAAHDFWLTRNHHGAGFWDRGHGEDGKRLTEIASAFGSCDLLPGDDGVLYWS